MTAMSHGVMVSGVHVFELFGVCAPVFYLSSLSPMCYERMEGGEDYVPKFKIFMLVATSSCRHIIFLTPESDFWLEVIVSRK